MEIVSDIINSNNKISIYKQNKPSVIECIKKGQMDYADLSSWTFFDNFYAYLFEIKFFEEIAAEYPSPRERHNIPLFFLISSYMQMRYRTENAFLNLPYILRSGSILNNIGYNIKVESGGFNNKNKKCRESVIDQDTLRKFFKDTEPEELMRWYNNNVVSVLKRRQGLTKEGIYILDSTLLPVPDNPNYTRTDLIPLDNNGNYVDVDKLSEAEKKKFRRTRCYKFVSLLNTSSYKDYYIYAGGHMGGGKNSELTVGKKIIEEFISRYGKGVIKILLVDRGFLDTFFIAKLKSEYGIDVVIPLKKNLEIYTESIEKAKKKSEWIEYKNKVTKDGITEIVELSVVNGLNSWFDSGITEINGVVVRKRERKESRIISEDTWILVTTLNINNPVKIYELYELRTDIEERHKQLKVFWGINKFTTPDFALNVAHVFFTILAYSVIEFYFKKSHLKNLAAKTIKTLQYQECMGKNNVIVYVNDYFAVFDIMEYSRILLSLNDIARLKLFKKATNILSLKCKSP